MQFDLFYELALPSHMQRSELQTYTEAMDELEYADTLGFGCAWFVEHHFMREYSHLSKPEIFIGALSQRTKNLHLGHAIIPLPLHHPVHVAERIATLDILTSGRLEVGIGRGFSPQEFSVFGVEMANSRRLAEESLEILRASFARKPLQLDLQNFQLDQIDVVPQVVQENGPPLWTAAVSPDSFQWAALQGLDVLAGPFKPWFMVKQDIARFHELCLKSETHRVAPRTGMTVGIVCLEDEKLARQWAETALTWFYKELYRTTLPVLEGLYPGYEHFHGLGRFRKLIKMGINLRLLETFGMAVVGTPEQCVKRLKKYQRAGVTNLLCAIGAGAMPSELVKESMRCISEKVMPAFR